MSSQIKGQFKRLAGGMRSAWFYLAVAVALSAIVAMALPEPIANNTFLKAFLPSEILAHADRPCNRHARVYREHSCEADDHDRR